jgi:hypothetical protein
MESKSKRLSTIPLVVDVERNIDGYEMVRCAYYSIESETPLLGTEIEIQGTDHPFLFLHLEAIFLGSPINQDYFYSTDDIDAMYEFTESHEGLFVDINDIWIPISWFGKQEIKQGRIFRIPVDRFIACWKFRHDHIAVEELIATDLKEVAVYLDYSEEESRSFDEWTRLQISQSQEFYHSNRDNYLQKIKS